MFDLSITQIVIVLVVALLVFGPTRLPELGRQIGKGLREVRRHATAVGEDLKSAVEEDDRRARAAPTPSPVAPDPVSDDELLDGVVIGGGPEVDVTPAPVTSSALTTIGDDVLDGVVVPGGTPPDAHGG